MTQRWTSTTALAAYLGLTEWSVRKWIRTGKLKAHAIQQRHYTDDRPRKTQQARWRIYEADLVTFLERFRAGTKPPPGLLRR